MVPPLHQGITICAIGGLGNQLFQYAVGRSIAVRLGSKLFLDCRRHKKVSNRPLLLNHFCHHGEILESNFLPLKISKFFFKNFEIPKLVAQGRFVEEIPNDQLRQVGSAKLGDYLRGFWQDPSHFSEIENLLREELRFVTRSSSNNLEIQEQISNCCAVSVHIRRGDYLTNPHHKATFASCNPAYYAKAFDALVSKLGNTPVFFVFSDDQKWAKENIRFPGKAVFVTHNDNSSSWEDMRLMAQCQHHIIANSTFSWWGAWLNASPSKIVVAPRNWFTTDLDKKSPLLLPYFVVVENEQILG